MIMKKNYWVFMLLMALINPKFSIAQSSILDNYLKIGLENNLTLKYKQLSYDKSLQALTEAKGLFYPNVSFNASYQLAAGGRTIDLPLGDLFNPIYGTLNQLTNSNSFPTDMENASEQLLANNFHDTKIRVIQPLFNTDIYFNYKAKEELVALENVKKATYEQELTKEIKTAYYQYLQTVELLKIYDQTETVLKELLRVNKKLVANQKATKDIIFSANYELTKLENERIIADKNQQVAGAYFNFLLNRDLEDSIEIDENIVLAANITTLENLKKQAIAERLELEQLKYAKGANQQLIELNEYAKYPKLNLVTDGGFQGFGYTFDDNQDYIFMQVALQWNIFDGKQRKSKLEQAKIQNQVLDNQYAVLEQQIQLQVQRSFYELQAAKSTLETSESAISNAQQRFNIINKKYRQNQSNLLEFLDAENSVSNTRKRLVIDKYAYLIKQVELDWVSGKL